MSPTLSHCCLANIRFVLAEMADEVNTFRARLRGAWIRRATRIISLHPLTPKIIEASQNFRDPEWARRERGFHEASVNAINSLIRKYNMVAPSSVRKAITNIEDELSYCYRDCASLIREELERRVKAGLGGGARAHEVKLAGEAPKGKLMPEQEAVRETMMSAFRRLVREVVGSKS